MHTILQIQHARGRVPGNFFCGRRNFWGKRTGAIPEPSAVDFQELVDGRDHTAIRPENRFRAGGSDCLLADAILKPSAGEFQRLADGRDRVATAGIFWRESNFYFVAAIAPPGGAHRPKKSK